MRKPLIPMAPPIAQASAKRKVHGTWRIDEKSNAYCNTFTGKKGTEEGCFAVFRAPDGTHYFDYEVDTGFLPRRAAA